MGTDRTSYIELDNPTPKPSDADVLGDTSARTWLGHESSKYFPQTAMRWLETTKPLPGFREIVEREAARKVDSIASTHNMHFSAAPGNPAQQLQVRADPDSENFWSYSADAAGDLATILGKHGATVADLMRPRSGINPNNSADLAASLLNRHLEDVNADGGKDVMVRAKRMPDGTVMARSVRGKDYRRLDNEIVVDALDSAFKTQGHADARVSHLSWSPFLGDLDFNLLLPDSMNDTAKIIDPETDSAYLVGYHIRNSERGRAAIELEQMLIRAICINGCIHGMQMHEIKFRQEHRGNITVEEVRDRILGVLAKWGEQHLVQEILEGIVATRAVEVPDVARTISHLTLRSEFPKRVANEWVIGYNVEVGATAGINNTAFAVTQGLTRAAQAWDSVDHRRIAERLVGRLSIPARGSLNDEWERIRKGAASLTDHEVEKLVEVKVA